MRWDTPFASVARPGVSRWIGRALEPAEAQSQTWLSQHPKGGNRQGLHNANLARRTKGRCDVRSAPPGALIYIDTAQTRTESPRTRQVAATQGPETHIRRPSSANREPSVFVSHLVPPDQTAPYGHRNSSACDGEQHQTGFYSLRRAVRERCGSGSSATPCSRFPRCLQSTKMPRYGTTGWSPPGAYRSAAFMYWSAVRGRQRSDHWPRCAGLGRDEAHQTISPVGLVPCDSRGLRPEAVLVYPRFG